MKNAAKGENLSFHSKTGMSFVFSRSNHIMICGNGSELSQFCRMYVRTGMYRYLVRYETQLEKPLLECRSKYSTCTGTTFTYGNRIFLILAEEVPVDVQCT
jgi:hypothetical protein